MKYTIHIRIWNNKLYIYVISFFIYFLKTLYIHFIRNSSLVNKSVVIIVLGTIIKLFATKYVVVKTMILTFMRKSIINFILCQMVEVLISYRFARLRNRYLQSRPEHIQNICPAKFPKTIMFYILSEHFAVKRDFHKTITIFRVPLGEPPDILNPDEEEERRRHVRRPSSTVRRMTRQRSYDDEMKNVAAMSGGGGQHAHPEPGLGLPVQLPRRASAYDVYATPGAGGLNAMAIAAAQQRASISAQGKSCCINTLSSAHVNVHLSYIVGSERDAGQIRLSIHFFILCHFSVFPLFFFF